MRECQGLLSDGIEPITTKESAWLNQRAQRNRRHIILFIVGAMIYMVAFVVVAAATFGVNFLSFVLMLVLLVVPLLALKSKTEWRAFASARCQTVEIITVPLSQVEFEANQPIADEDRDSLPEIHPPFRRLVGTGEILQRDGDRFLEPYRCSVQECPPDSAPIPSGKRRLTADELSELRGPRIRAQINGGVWAVLSLAVSILILKDGVDRSLLSVVGGLVVGLAGIFGLVRGLGDLFDNDLMGDIRDAHAYVNGREEKLASGRLWRFDGVPALDRWRVVKD